mgnify:CR=1 FL=1|jgi:hypothetical protein
MWPPSPVLRRFALAHFFLECQFWFPVWMLFLTHRGFDLTTMVLADGVFRFTMVALEFPMGVFSDRIGRKRSYVLIATLAAATYAGIVLVDGTAMLFAVWILWGVFWALASGSTSAYCYELLALEGRQDESVAVFGFMRAVASSAALVSHLAAGFLFAGAPALPFVANGVLALGAVGLAITLPNPPREGGRTQRPRSFRQFLALDDRGSSVFVGLVLLALALIYFWSPRILMQPLFIELSLAPVLVSTVYFFYSLAGVTAGLAMRPIQARMGTRPSILAGLGLLWLGVWLVALVPGRAALFFFPLLSFGYYLAQTLLEVVLHGQLANRYRASILSAASFMGGIVIIVTRPGLGVLADAMSAPFAFLVWAGVGVVIAGAFVALVRRLPADQPAT